MNVFSKKATIPIIMLYLLIIFYYTIQYHKNIKKSEGEPNYYIKGSKIYIPTNWKEENNYHISPSGNCRLIGGITLNSQSQMEQEIVKKELEHKDIIINNIDINYGYQEDKDKKIYSYFFEDYSNKYFILFINNNDSDEECNSYIEKLERSIILEPKGEEI